MQTTKWSRRKLLKFSAITILAIFLLLEITGRIVFYSKFGGLGTSVYVQGSPLIAEDSFSIYKNRPCYVDYQKRFQYNEEGMKSQTGNYLMPAKSAGDLWVLLLGASAMEGMGSNKNGKWFDITNVPDHPHGETIAAFLQSDLQKKFPGKKVRVFNAGVSAFTLSQSIKRYESLSRKYNFDWVISMDGVNEPADLAENETMLSYNQKSWESQPFHHFPLKAIVAVTRHSAFLNLVKQELFYFRQNIRSSANKANQFPERAFWLKQQVTDSETVITRGNPARVSRLFLSELEQFEERLSRDGKQHLLLVQPHLAFRPKNKFSSEENALYNYYRKEYNDNAMFTFLRLVYDSVNRQRNMHIQTMDGLQDWPGWTFVDYCHFTTTANKRIAMELSNFIVSGGSIRVFQH